MKIKYLKLRNWFLLSLMGLIGVTGCKSSKQAQTSPSENLQTVEQQDQPQDQPVKKKVEQDRGQVALMYGVPTINYRVRGKVVNHNGKPVKGIQVVMLNRSIGNTPNNPGEDDPAVIEYMQQYAVAAAANLIQRSRCTEMPGVAFNNQAEVEIRTDVPNKAFYKDFLNEDGVGLSDYKTLTVTTRLNLSTETVYTRTNDAANQAAQNRLLIGDENDENGILLYPDGEPRYRMMYVNGGQSYTHGPSLMAAGRENFRKFVYGGGCYLASCAGSYVGSLGILEAGTTTSNPAMMAYNGYIGLWPGLVDNTGLTNAYPDYIIPEDSPLLQYDDFGGDFRVDSIKQWNGPYFSGYASVPGTEVLARFDYPAYRCHGHPSIISYKPSPFCGRITLIGGHPEQYSDYEGAKLMDALTRYSLDSPGIAKIKGILRNGELREMTRPTSANDPAHAKVGDRQCHHFAFGLPAGARNIRIRLEVLDDFNVSLRMARGTFAFAEDAQYSVENSDRVKEMTFDTLEAGTWYIGVQCEDTVTNDPSSTYGISYSGKIAALNGAPYTVKVTWE